MFCTSENGVAMRLVNGTEQVIGRGLPVNMHAEFWYSFLSAPLKNTL